MRYILAVVALFTVCCAGCTMFGPPMGAYQRDMPRWNVTEDKSKTRQADSTGKPTTGKVLHWTATEARNKARQADSTGKPAPSEMGAGAGTGAQPVKKPEAKPFVRRVSATEKKRNPKGSTNRKTETELLTHSQWLRRMEEAKSTNQKAKPELLPRRFSVGPSMGNVYGKKGRVVKGLSGTEFQDGMLWGFSATYFPAMRKIAWDSLFNTRYGIEMRLEDYELTLFRSNLKVGRLHTTSVVFGLRLFQMPEKDRVFGFHLDFGIGWGATYFKESSGTNVDISTETATIFALGAGLDLTFAPDSCVSLDFKFEQISMVLEWVENGTLVPGANRLDADNTRLVISLRFFF